MKGLLNYIFGVLARQERARINEADANPGKWYELLVTRDDGSTESVKEGDTFSETIENTEQYAVEYKLDRINIGIYENRESPNKTYSFFTTSLIYWIILNYFLKMDTLDNMRFAGSITFVDHNPVLEKEYVGDESEIFIDEIAFTYFHNLVCYLPDYGEETDSADWCTRKDFLEITNNDEKLAQHLFDEVTWEYPSTLFDQWDSHGTLEEHYRYEYAEKLEEMVFSRHASLEEIKQKVSEKLGLTIKTITEEDMSNRDDASTGYMQADFSLIIDIDAKSIPNDISEYAMATLYYLKDRENKYVITETHFAFE